MPLCLIRTGCVVCPTIIIHVFDCMGPPPHKRSHFCMHKFRMSLAATSCVSPDRSPLYIDTDDGSAS